MPYNLDLIVEENDRDLTADFGENVATLKGEKGKDGYSIYYMSSEWPMYDGIPIDVRLLSTTQLGFTPNVGDLCISSNGILFEIGMLMTESPVRNYNCKFLAIIKGQTGERGDKGDPGSIKFIPVASLPETDIDASAIYIIPDPEGTEENKFIEYAYINGSWEILGKIAIQVDHSEYVKFTDYPTGSETGPAGVVRVNNGVQGLQVNHQGLLVTIQANEELIKDRYADKFYNPARHQGIPPIQLDLAVEEGLANCQKPELWTDDSLDENNETIKGTKTKARELLGAVGFTDYATNDNTKAGVVKVHAGGVSGIDIDPTTHVLKIYPTTGFLIENRHDIQFNRHLSPITPQQLDDAIIFGSTNNAKTMTEEQKDKACEFYGAVRKDASAITDKHIIFRLYGIDEDGNQVIVNCNNGDFSNIAIPNAIPIGDHDGNIQVGYMPYWPSHAVSLWYLRNYPTYITDTEKANWIEKLGVLKKDTSTTTDGTIDCRVYAIDKDGNQIIENAAWRNNPNSIAMRDSNSQLGVALKPLMNDSATSKKYVDDLITALTTRIDELTAEVEALKTNNTSGG